MAVCRFCGGNVPAGRGNCPHCGGHLIGGEVRRRPGGWAGSAVPAREEEMFRTTGRRMYPVMLFLLLGAIVYALFGTVFRVQQGESWISVSLLRVIVQKRVLEGNILLDGLRYLHILAGIVLLAVLCASLSNYIFGTMNSNWGSAKAAFRCLQAAALSLLIPQVLLIAAYFVLLPLETTALPAGNLIRVIIVFLLFRICGKMSGNLSSYGW